MPTLCPGCSCTRTYTSAQRSRSTSAGYSVVQNYYVIFEHPYLYIWACPILEKWITILFLHGSVYYLQSLTSIFSGSKPAAYHQLYPSFILCYSRTFCARHLKRTHCISGHLTKQGQLSRLAFGEYRQLIIIYVNSAQNKEYHRNVVCLLENIPMNFYPHYI